MGVVVMMFELLIAIMRGCGWLSGRETETLMCFTCVVSFLFATEMIIHTLYHQQQQVSLSDSEDSHCKALSS